MSKSKSDGVLEEFKLLMEPLRIRGLHLDNRIAMSPMTRSFCPDNLPDDKVAQYYKRRAKGGAGLISTEAIGTDHPAAVGDTGLGETDLPIFSGDHAVEAWAKVVDAVHDADGKIISQVWHQGPCVCRIPNRSPRRSRFRRRVFMGTIPRLPITTVKMQKFSLRKNCPCPQMMK